MIIRWGVCHRLAPDRQRAVGHERADGRRRHETITGSGFTDATLVSFGDRPATGLKVLSNTQVRLTVPAGTAGTVNVAVHDPAGASAVVAADRYTYTSGSAPAFTAQSPPSSVAAGASYAYTFAASGTPTPTYALVAGSGVAEYQLCDRCAAGHSPGAYIADTLHYKVVRLAGATRDDTALAIANDPRALNNPAHIVLARGDDFPDALAAGPYASDRQGTANATQVGVATGFGFPDALTGGAFMALVDGRFC